MSEKDINTVTIKVEADEVISDNNLTDELGIKIEIKDEPEYISDNGSDHGDQSSDIVDHTSDHIRENSALLYTTIHNYHAFSHIQEDSMSPAMSTLPNSPDSTCRVEILEEPMKKVRFRYLSELQGTPHGPLLGERSSKSNKTFPRVRLVGYDSNEPVKMRCWLVDKAPRSLGSGIRPHCHDLVVRRNVPKSEIVSEPHELLISRDNNYTAVFENMVVLHCVQKDSEMKYFSKESKWKARSQDEHNEKFDRKRIRDTIKCINKNEVYLYFEAYMVYRNNTQHILCSALSNPIKNLKNPVSGDLKICRVVNACGSTDGNTEVALFTEKIPPDVRIKFSDDANDWIEYISPEYTHRNLALTFKSPVYPYDIDGNRKVRFCLYRESDNGESNSFEFTYLPGKVKVQGAKKRKLDTFNEKTGENHLDNNQLFNGQYETIATCTTNGEVYVVQGAYTPAPILELINMPMITDPVTLNADKPSLEMIDKYVSEDITLEEVLNEADPGSVSVNWSAGSTLDKLEALSSPDIVVGSTTGGAYESDGVTETSKTIIRDRKAAEFGNMLAGSRKISGGNTKLDLLKKKMDNIINDILFSQKYSYHVNCLQKAVLENRKDLVDKLLSTVEKYLENQNNHRLFNIIRLIKNDECETLLQTAVKQGYSDVVSILLKFGYNPCLHDMDGNNCFHIASTQLSRSVLKILTNNTSQKIIETNANGFNILHLAVNCNSLDNVKHIVESKIVGINSQHLNSGDTPLHLACRLRLYSIADYLLQNGANMDAVNLSGFTPLQLSVDMNDHLIASLLISKKSDPLQECRSLVLGKSDRFDDYVEEDKASTIEQEHSNSQLNAYALAQDLMMINILSGKLSMMDLKKHDSKDNTGKQPNCNIAKGDILNSDQIEELNILLSKNDRWKILVKELNLEKFLPMITAGAFKEPAKVLLNLINRKQTEILGDTREDKSSNLINAFKKMQLDEAVTVIIH